MAPLVSPAPASSLAIAGIGAQVRVEVAGPLAAEVHGRLARAWVRCLDAAAGPDGGTVRVEADERPEHLLAGVTQQVTRALIGAQTGRLLMLHAGAVSHPTSGRSLVFVAEGGTGKTTLTRVLARRYGYLSDETVAIDADHRVLPYPKPLSIRREDPGRAEPTAGRAEPSAGRAEPTAGRAEPSAGRAEPTAGRAEPSAGRAVPPAGWLPKQELSPDDLGLAHPPAGATVARLVLLDRKDGFGDQPDVAELGLLDAITAIAPQSSALYALPTGLRRCAELIEATGPVLRVRYAEAESLHDLIAELIGPPE